MIIKKRIIILLLLVSLFGATLTGSFAIFFDREYTFAEATAGNVNIKLTNVNLFPDIHGYGGAVGFYSREEVPVSWTVNNIGSKSAVVRQRLIFSLFDENGNPLDISETLIYDMFPALEDGTADYDSPYTNASIDGNKLTYTFEDILSGNSSHDVYEEETGYDTSISYDNRFLFTANMESENVPSMAICTVDLVVEAKQYRNGYDVPWTRIQSESIILGNGEIIDVTPKY